MDEGIGSDSTACQPHWRDAHERILHNPRTICSSYLLLSEKKTFHDVTLASSSARHAHLSERQSQPSLFSPLGQEYHLNVTTYILEGKMPCYGPV